MSMLGSIRRQLTPIHPEGYIFIAGFALATLVLGSFFGSLFWIGAIATAWCAYFFRDPVRLTPLDENLVISPADGVVSSVGYFAPPPELGLGAEPMQRVSIFMSVFDCHVNRAPVAGRVTKIAYRPGLFLNADLDKASENNERNGLVIEGGSLRAKPYLPRWPMRGGRNSSIICGGGFDLARCVLLRKRHGPPRNTRRVQGMGCPLNRRQG